MSGVRARNTDSLQGWLQTRAPAWQRAERLLARLHGRGRVTLEEAVEAADLERALIHDLSLARATLPSHSQLPDALSKVVLGIDRSLRAPAWRLRPALVDYFGRQVPSAFARLRNAFNVSAAIFIASLLLGYLACATNPDFALLLFDRTGLARLEAGELWTDGLHAIVPGSVLSAQIAINNVVVTVTAFVLGAFFGIGTLYILGLNGLMIGSMFAITAAHGLSGRLFEFVMPHGPTELSIIVLAAACGLHVGESLVHPGEHGRVTALRRAMKSVGPLVPFGALWLVCSGIIEGYVSPNPSVGFVSRAFVGVMLGFLFWTQLLGLGQRAPRPTRTNSQVAAQAADRA